MITGIRWEPLCPNTGYITDTSRGSDVVRVGRAVTICCHPEMEAQTRYLEWSEIPRRVSRRGEGLRVFAGMRAGNGEFPVPHFWVTPGFPSLWHPGPLVRGGVGGQRCFLASFLRHMP